VDGFYRSTAEGGKDAVFVTYADASGEVFTVPHDQLSFSHTKPTGGVDSEPFRGQSRCV
jgi:hypothetical protein